MNPGDAYACVRFVWAVGCLEMCEGEEVGLGGAGASVSQKCSVWFDKILPSRLLAEVVKNSSRSNSTV